jgi:hypothetical protein
MELTAIQQLTEDFRYLGLDDPRTVVLNDHEEAALALGELRVLLHGLEAEVVDLDAQLGQDAGFLAGVERVVDGFLDGGEQRLRGVVEAEQVAVLGEELGDRDLALLLGEGFGGGAPRSFFGRRRGGNGGRAELDELVFRGALGRRRGMLQTGLSFDWQEGTTMCGRLE